MMQVSCRSVRWAEGREKRARLAPGSDSNADGATEAFVEAKNRQPVMVPMMLFAAAISGARMFSIVDFGWCPVRSKRKPSTSVVAGPGHDRVDHKLLHEIESKSRIGGGLLWEGACTRQGLPAPPRAASYKAACRLRARPAAPACQRVRPAAGLREPGTDKAPEPG